jgi:hypothetical protein
MSLNIIEQENQIQLDELKQLIDNCREFEGRFYLLHIYNTLINSNKSVKEVTDTANQLIALIKNINDITNPNLASADKINAVKKIAENYAALVIQTGTNGMLYKCKQAILDLGGLILGVITAVFGAVIGSVSMGIQDMINFNVPTGPFIGAFTGLLVGYTIGQRVPHKLFKENDTRIIRHAVNKLKGTFDSLFKSHENDYREEISNKILADYFQGNKELFQAFLEGKHKYEILGISAQFFSEKLKGSLGHHSFIRFYVNNSEIPQLIEMGVPSDKVVDFTQIETREATGEQLINMLVMDKVLRPQYELSLGNIHNFTKRYKPGVTDCHTYLDKVLLSAGEPASNVQRFTNNDTFMGRMIGNALRFFSPLPEKLEGSDPSCACDPINP